MRFNDLRLLVISLIPMIFLSPAQAQQLLSEASIMQMAQKSTPITQEIEARQQAKTAEQFAVKSQYDPKLATSYSYSSSKENAIIQFIPVFRPQKLFNLGLSQKTSLGTTINTQVFSQQISTADGFINNATQVGVSLGMEVDIWKNALGRLDRSQLRSAKLGKQVSDLQSDIDKQSFVIDVRKIYWSLIANELSLKLSKQLVETAKAQLKDSQKRLKEGLGDSGDIARNQAQLQSRTSSALFFEYQKELLIAQLKSLLPDLKSANLVINSRESLDMEKRTKQCMQSILLQRQMDTKFSRYDEISSLLGKQQENELRLAKATDSFDVKLQAQYQASGVDASHSQAFDTLNDNFLNGYQVGLSLQIPIGGDLSRSQSAQVAATQNRFEAQKTRINLQLKAEHEKIIRTVELLRRATESQGTKVAHLKTSLKKTKRKYRQARVSLNTYILEQDNLFNSELQLIDTKRQVLHMLLDYFKIFSHYPCAINKTQGV